MENTEEIKRLQRSSDNRTWRKWGPYVSERQWGTIREDYSKDGQTWDAISHDHARSNAYRWGEDGIAGFCDSQQILCLAPAFWNGKDPFLKERLFGLTNGQGNHGEDVKEIYYHLESSPTHSYCKYLYKYPQEEFPYEELVEQNRTRDRNVREFEITDSGIFEEDRYFDIFIEYAKAGINDILMKITVVNRGPEEALIHVLPHLWFRNFWKHNDRFKRPEIKTLGESTIHTNSYRNGSFYFYHQGGEQLFCENETNNQVIYQLENDFDYVKDGINNHVVNGEASVNPAKTGTKCAIWYTKTIPAGASAEICVRLSKNKLANPFENFEEAISRCKADSDAFYAGLLTNSSSDEQKFLAKSALGGLLWTKQYYYFDVYKWLNGEQGKTPPERDIVRNHNWQHLTNRNIISMPDKWEYPWYAAWDLAFHCTSFAHIDVGFAKRQLLLMLKEYYMHPNGQIPAYEWNFSDVNPPVHAMAVWQVYTTDRKKTGKSDFVFLEKAFQKLLLNFTWWVNRKDADGTDVFEGGFLGLDNIGVFDRNNMPLGIMDLQQADATSWMAMFSLNMLQISLELAQHNLVYEESAAKFFRHFLNIAWAMNNIGDKEIPLWDDEDKFFYDVVRLEDGRNEKLRVRSLVGITPLFAVEVIDDSTFKNLRRFKRRAVEIIKSRPDLASLISDIEVENSRGEYLFAIMRNDRLEKILDRLLDEAEFLSDYGIRSLSKYHEENPYAFEYNGGRHTIEYVPGESSSPMFGGNSNWRGPIWLPLNYLIIISLKKYYKFYGPTVTYEFPKGSGKQLNLKEIAMELTNRLLRIFEKNSSVTYHYFSNHPVYNQENGSFNYHQFFEYFNGDTGEGLGASHQTGWTSLIANLIIEMNDDDV
ncbi:MGH1-like glycoside hydrolase domain-containing protein [Mangrovibacterium lignilyticum]|uniref:MGH1-like glycoside hydrolase domain-containing protein n=1 Tax=Mangrovibacterium lignilyticum TaxID=2668052 RepID=UPI0013D29A1F|nr:glucosidase [Mangrovibacterium lignilyticum]